MCTWEESGHIYSQRKIFSRQIQTTPLFFANLLLVSERKNTLENSARMIIVDAEAGTAASWGEVRNFNHSFTFLPGTWSRRGRGGSARISAWGDKEEEPKEPEPSLRRHNETRQHLGSFEQCFLIKCVQGWTTHHMKNVEVLVEILLAHCLEEM